MLAERMLMALVLRKNLHHYLQKSDALVLLLWLERDGHNYLFGLHYIVTLRAEGRSGG